MSKLAHSNQETMDQIERDAENDRPDEPADGVFFHSTPKLDDCAHDFQGWRALKDDDGNECGGTTICTKCGMDAFTYSLRTGF